MSATKIDWCDTVWNPVVGCSKVSEGCRNCYAERFARRNASNPKTAYKYAPVAKWDGSVFFDEKALEAPLHWRKPRRVFVNSMGDLCHENVRFEWVHEVMDTMKKYPQHTFYMLTKRPENMVGFVEKVCAMERLGYAKGFWSHVWLGVSVENQETADERIPELLKIPGFRKFISVEPMLGNIIVNDTPCYETYEHVVTPSVKRVYHKAALEEISWVICGGETGPGARPMHPDNVRSLRDQCAEAGVPFFFKSWGEYCPGCQLPCETKIVNYDSSVLMNALGDIGKSFPTDDGVDNVIRFFKIGKKRSGYILDGKEHRELPA